MQGEIRYEVIGDLPAPSYFSINEKSGAISVKEDLKTDDEMEYTVSCVDRCTHDDCGAFCVSGAKRILQVWACILDLQKETNWEDCDLRVLVGSEREHALWWFQLRVIAYDSANPAQQATALVTIAVTRNENAPRFPQPRYVVAMAETAALGATVRQVEASDEDESVSSDTVRAAAFVETLMSVIWQREPEIDALTH